MPKYRTHEQYDPFLGHSGPPQNSGPFVSPSFVFVGDLEKCTPQVGPPHIRKFNSHVPMYFSAYQRESLISERLVNILKLEDPSFGNPVRNELKVITFPDGQGGTRSRSIACKVITLNDVVIIEAPIKNRRGNRSMPQKVEFVVLTQKMLVSGTRLPETYVCLGYDFIQKNFENKIEVSKDAAGKRQYALRSRQPSFCDEQGQNVLVGTP